MKSYLGKTRNKFKLQNREDYNFLRDLCDKMSERRIFRNKWDIDTLKKSQKEGMNVKQNQ